MKKLALILTFGYGLAIAAPVATSADNSEGSPKVIMVKPSSPQNKSIANVNKANTKKTSHTTKNKHSAKSQSKSKRHTSAKQSHKSHKSKTKKNKKS